VSSFMHQATLMSPCPCFFSFQTMPLHISHFPRSHLATSHRHHVPTRTTKWLVACTRALSSVLVNSTSYFRVCLFVFILFLGDLPSYTPPFRRVRCSHYMCQTHAHVMRDAAFQLRPHYTLWLGWPYLTKKIQSKKPRPSTPPSESVLAAGKMSP
jgi:hypothetical protein